MILRRLRSKDCNVQITVVRPSSDSLITMRAWVYMPSISVKRMKCLRTYTITVNPPHVVGRL